MIEFFLFVEAFDNFIHTKLAESFLISWFLKSFKWIKKTKKMLEGSIWLQSTHILLIVLFSPLSIATKLFLHCFHSIQEFSLCVGCRSFSCKWNFYEYSHSIVHKHCFFFVKVRNCSILYELLSIWEACKLHHVARIHQLRIESNDLHSVQSGLSESVQEAARYQTIMDELKNRT
jgi:hypothetical protein